MAQLPKRLVKDNGTDTPRPNWKKMALIFVVTDLLLTIIFTVVQVLFLNALAGTFIVTIGILVLIGGLIVLVIAGRELSGVCRSEAAYRDQTPDPAAPFVTPPVILYSPL